jgi:hypothetical protein
MPFYSQYNRQGLTYIISLDIIYYSKCIYLKIKCNITGSSPSD